MQIPQIILLSLALLGTWIDAWLHGKPKDGNHNFFVSLTKRIVLLLILYYGGFFN